MPDVPDAAKKPQDHKAAKTEAADPAAPISFHYDGVDYLIDPAFRDDIEILEELEQDHTVSAVKRILGTEQWQAWKDANRGKNGRVRVTDAQPFLTQLFEELGQGN